MFTDDHVASADQTVLLLKLTYSFNLIRDLFNFQGNQQAGGGGGGQGEKKDDKVCLLDAQKKTQSTVQPEDCCRLLFCICLKQYIAKTTSQQRSLCNIKQGNLFYCEDVSTGNIFISNKEYVELPILYLFFKCCEDYIDRCTANIAIDSLY